jgi:thiol:disulfide interchange protein
MVLQRKPGKGIRRWLTAPRAWLCVLLACAVQGWAQPSQSPQSPASVTITTEHLQLTLLSDVQAVRRSGQDFQLGLRFQLQPGWHIYWINAGDSGLPPRVQWLLPASLPADAIGPLQFPVPHRLPLGPLMDFGYEGDVLLPVQVHFQPDQPVSGSALAIAAHVHWLVCHQSCIPGQGTVALQLPLQSTLGTANAENAALFAAAERHLPQPLPPGAHIRVEQNGNLLLLTAYLGRSVAHADFYPLDSGLILNAAPQISTPTPDGLRLQVERDPTAPAPHQLHGLLVLDDGTGYAFTSPVTAAALAPAPQHGLAFIALLAFAGGALLNLMPCVFPVLFLKGLALVQSSTEERARLRLHGFVYALGILVSFWSIVALLLLLRASGHHIGWGFQFQSPMFVASIALLLFFLGLSLAGQFELGLSLTSAGGSLARQPGLAGSFFTGVLATVVATPCTAPLMGVAIGYALAQSAAVTGVVFTALALGLAAPYVLLTLQPAWVRLLPRPGAWMEILKQATAVPIFATVLWLVWVFARLAGSDAATGLLGAFLLAAIAGWVLGRWPARIVPTCLAVSILLASLALPWLALRDFASVPSQASSAQGALTWQPYDPQQLSADRAQGKAVFVDFTAAWCLSCQVNERLVLSRADVQQALRSSQVILMRADWTRHDDAITQALTQLGRSGVPTYALFVGEQAPTLLPEALTPGAVIDALRSVSPATQK